MKLSKVSNKIFFLLEQDSPYVIHIALSSVIEHFLKYDNFVVFEEII